MILVRLLLFFALATVGAALLMYVIKRDRRYLRFIFQVAKFTILVMLCILILFAAERLLAPMLGALV